MPALTSQIPQDQLFRELQQLLLVNVGVILLVVVVAAAIVAVLVRRGMRQRVEAERLRAMGLATARILHQVKNPLQAIMLNAELLADEGIAEDPVLRGEACESIVAGADRMSELLADLSAYASGVRRRLNPEALPLHELVRDAVRSETGVATRRGTELNLDIDREVVVRADRYFLRQALDNVIRNAREALDEVGDERGRRRIRVRVSRRGDDATIEVQDNGPGIEPDRLESVFRPFITTKGMGMGLGLAIARDIVEGHGGRIEIRSRPGEGTTVSFRLPALPAGISLTPA